MIYPFNCASWLCQNVGWKFLKIQAHEQYFPVPFCFRIRSRHAAVFNFIETTLPANPRQKFNSIGWVRGAAEEPGGSGGSSSHQAASPSLPPSPPSPPPRRRPREGTPALRRRAVLRDWCKWSWAGFRANSERRLPFLLFWKRDSGLVDYLNNYICLRWCLLFWSGWWPSSWKLCQVTQKKKFGSYMPEYFLDSPDLPWANLIWQNCYTGGKLPDATSKVGVVNFFYF